MRIVKILMLAGILLVRVGAFYLPEVKPQSFEEGQR
jgi:hypothetical protein